MPTLEKSPETVQIVPHPIRVGWTLLIATVEIPPSPAMLPTFADALRRHGIVYLQPAAA